MVKKICSFLGITVLTAGITAVKAEEPMRLAERQLDTVTAGDIAVGVNATALATGTSTTTYANTTTNVRSQLGGIVEVGSGSGQAYAASTGTGTQTAEVNAAGYASGAVTSVVTYGTNMNTLGSASASGGVLAVSATPPNSW